MRTIQLSIIVSALLIGHTYGNPLSEDIRREIQAALSDGIPIMVGKAIVGHRGAVEIGEIHQIKESEGAVLVYVGNSICYEILSLKQICNVKAKECFWFSKPESRPICH